MLLQLGDAVSVCVYSTDLASYGEYTCETMQQRREMQLVLL